MVSLLSHSVESSSGRGGSRRWKHRSDVTGARQEDQLVACGRGYPYQRPADVAPAQALPTVGYGGPFDRRRGQPSPKWVPLATVEQVL